MKFQINNDFFKHVFMLSKINGLPLEEIQAQITALVGIAATGDSAVFELSERFIDKTIFDFFCEEYMNYSLTEGYSLKVQPFVSERSEILIEFYKEVKHQQYSEEEECLAQFGGGSQELSTKLVEFFIHRTDVNMEQLVRKLFIYYRSKIHAPKGLTRLLGDAYILEGNFE